MAHGLTANCKDRILQIHFKNDESANAFGVEQALELERLLNQFSAAHVLVWRAEGSRIFCGGGNLHAYAKMKTAQQGLVANKKIAGSINKLSRFKGRTLAIVEGDCFGSGLELLSGFDEVWAVPSAGFGFWQRRVGLSPGWGGFGRWSQKLKLGRIKNELLAAEFFGVQKALEMGMIQRIVSPHFVITDLENWIQKELSLPRHPLAKIKSLTNKNETKTFAQLWWKSEHLAALRHFLKRSRKL